MSQVSFQYQAIDAQGAKTKGMLNAANQEDAYRKLLALGLKPLRIANRRGRVRGGTIGGVGSVASRAARRCTACRHHHHRPGLHQGLASTKGLA